MLQKQDLLEKTHKTLYYSMSPIEKYSAFVKFEKLRSATKLNIFSPKTFLLFLIFLFIELTYTLNYRIRSN